MDDHHRFALIVVVFLLVHHGLPALYDAGFAQHNKAGLAAQYSAIDMLLVAAFCVWAIMVVAATWTGLVVMGRLGVVNSTTADVWRLRLYGVGSLLLVLSIPDHAQSMLLPLLATYWTTSELVGQRWLYAQPLLKDRPLNGSTTRDDDNELHCWIAPARARTFTTVMPASRVAPPFRLMQFAPHPPLEQLFWNTWFRPRLPMQ